MKPLTPPECDLQDFPFMPLHVARLRDSDLAAEEAPEACWYAVLLWAAAWHQIPAGSLPDNDAVLTKLIGLGRDVRTFRKHRAAALRGFVLCDDGRLYHPVVADQAMTAWEGKLQQRWRTECARIKKQNQRNETNLQPPTYEEFLSVETPAPSPSLVPDDKADCPQGQGLQERGTGTGKGTTSSEDKSSASDALNPDLDAEAWGQAVKLLAGQGRQTEATSRKFFGKLLATNGLMARDMLPAITAARVNKTEEPQAYLSQSAKGIATRRKPQAETRVDWV